MLASTAGSDALGHDAALAGSLASAPCRPGGGRPTGRRLVGSLTILRALSRYSRHQHMVDLFVTNVPGPQHPLYLLGARLLEAFPVVQVAGNVPLSVAVLSYAGQLNIGIQSDPDGLPDLDVFVDSLRQSLEELGAATSSRPG